MSFADEFDWNAYSTASGSRFIGKNYNPLSSSAAENTFFLLSLIVLAWWLSRIAKQLYNILISTKYLHIQQRAIHLSGMSKWVDELKSLKKSHFNQILRIKRPVPPLFLSRVLISVNLKPQTLKISVDDFGDNVVEFKFDCKRTCFLTAHWGVPMDILHSVIGSNQTTSTDSAPSSTPSTPVTSLTPNIFFRAFFPRYYTSSDSLIVNTMDTISDSPYHSNRNGDISFFSSDRNLDASSEPLCFDPGTDHSIQLKPSSLTLERIAQLSSSQSNILEDEKIISLVVVLYIPNEHEAKSFTCGNIDTFNSYAQVTCIKINPKTSYRVKNTDGHINLSSDVDRQIIFSYGTGPHEPREMFGMGDKNDKECLICLAKEMDTVLLPCCHSSFCLFCIKSLKQEKCPICRTNFASYVSFNLKND